MSKVKDTIDIYRNTLLNRIETKPLCASSSKLADILTMVRNEFRGHRSKVKVTMGIINKCGVRGDGTLFFVIFCNRYTIPYNYMTRVKSSELH